MLRLKTRWNIAHGGAAAGGVSASGGRGFGGRMILGVGRTSIGGGSGASCWAAPGAFDGTSGECGTPILGFDGGRRGSRPDAGISESGRPGRSASDAPAEGCAGADGAIDAGNAAVGS